MNNTRRKQLRKAIELMETVSSIIEEMRDEEQECFDNMPEGIQVSERGEQIETNAYDLDEAYESLAEIIDNINDIIDR